MVDHFKADRLKRLLEAETAKVKQRQKSGAEVDVGSDSSGGLPSLPSEEGSPVERLDVTATPGGRGGGEEDRVQELLAVLQEASAEIKKERQVSEMLKAELERARRGEGVQEQLQEELAYLRDENDTLKQTLEAYKRKVCALSLTASLAVEQLASDRARMATTLPFPTPPPPPPQLLAQQQHHTPIATPTPTPVSAATHSAPRRASSQPPKRNPRSISPQNAHHDREHRNGQLMDRMRRAFAPPPKETMGLLVNSMVQELRRVMRERGTDLPLERKGDCLYMIGNKKVNLAVSGGKLVVKSGGGHHDFLTFLERYMHSKARK